MPTKKSNPHYQVTYNVHLPADKPWREENRNAKRTTTAGSPMELWRNVIVDMAQLLSFPGNAEFFSGLMMDTINVWPAEVRLLITAGLVQGLGLTLMVENEELVASLEQKYEPLQVATQPTPTPDGLQRTASGLIIPQERLNMLDKLTPAAVGGAITAGVLCLAVALGLHVGNEKVVPADSPNAPTFSVLAFCNDNRTVVGPEPAGSVVGTFWGLTRIATNEKVAWVESPQGATINLVGSHYYKLPRIDPLTGNAMLDPNGKPILDQQEPDSVALDADSINCIHSKGR